MKEKPAEILIAIKPSNQIIKVPVGTTLLSAIEKTDILLSAVCGGRGKCGKCKVKICQTDIPYSSNEQISLTAKEINNNIHLACQVMLDKDLEIEILSDELYEPVNDLDYVTFSENEIDRHLRKIYLELIPPNLDNPLDDVINIEKSIFNSQNLKSLKIPLSLLQNLSTFLRKNDYKITVVLNDSQVLNIESGDTTQRCFGLAFDLGTTTIGGILVDLNTGKDLAFYSITNPQYIYGADVISRINYSINEPVGLSKLQKLVIEAFNKIIEKLTQRADVSYREIYEMSVAGNTIMNHIFLGVNPQYIGEAPYIPTYRKGQTSTADELGMTLLPKAPVMTLPNISGYVGGDITGFILAHNLHKKDKVTLGIDIGTNGEIVLGSQKSLVCCSAAAGPAFEGGHISCGMRATIGAIERVVFDEEAIFCQVIGKVEPKGVCGTGLIDLLAEMLRFGLVSSTGKIYEPDEIKQDWYRSKIMKNENSTGFILVPAQETANKEPIVIKQKDIRELQLAKAAIAAGINILIQELNISEQDIEQVVIAGAFGTYINKYNAQFVGLIPKNISPEKISFVGNAASAGAKKFLLSENARREAQKIVEFTRYIELSMRDDFQKEYTEAMFFDHSPEI